MTMGAYENHLCPLCETKGEEYLRMGEYYIDKCTNCGFVYVRDVPSEEFLANYYRPLYGVSPEEYVPPGKIHKKLKNWWFAKRIKHLAKNRRRVLEIGHGHGYLLKALQREGIFEVEGIDYSDGPLQHLKSFGLNVSLSSLEDKKYPAGRFDVIVGLQIL